MKITIATGLYPPESGGPATYVSLLEETLPKHGIELNAVPFRDVRKYPKLIRHFAYTYKLWRASNSSDLILALDPVSVGLPTLVVSLLARRRYILRVPGDYAWEQGQLRFGVEDKLHEFIEKRMSYGWQVSLLCRIESLVAKKALHVIVPSDYMKSAVAKWGVEPKKITRVYSALTPIEVGESKSELREEFSFVGPVITSCGRLVPNKGFPTLIKAFSEVLKAKPDSRLIIIGDGPQQEELVKLITELDISKNVQLTGRLDKVELGRIIKASDLFVLNTAHEGMSHQLLEVIYLGTPIITTPVGGNVELITDGVEGKLVPYEDDGAIEKAILELLNGIEKGRDFATKAKLKLKMFEREVSVKETVDILLSEINNK